MTRLFGVLARADALVLVAWIGLTLFGLAAVFSCTVDFRAPEQVVPSTVDPSVFRSQVVWVAIGVATLILCLLLPFTHFEALAYLAYGVALALLVAVLVVGAEAGGGRRWLAFGGLTIQPSELAKVALVFALARFLSARQGRGPFFLITGTALLVAPYFVLVFREPDLGTGLVFGALAIPMLFWTGVRASLLLALASPLISAVVMFACTQVLDIIWPWVIFLLVLLVVLYRSRLYLLQSLALVLGNIVTGLAVPVVLSRLKPYQQARIDSFFDPADADRLGYGYQTFQSKVAIGSGGVLGKGYLEGSQKGLAFLPERHTDFIFSVIGEEFGLVGVLIVLALFGLLVIRAIRIASVSKRRFGSMLAIGVASYFAFQACVNIAIALGMLPVTGLPLPLISKGGSSMLASCAMVGLLLNVSARWSEV